MHYKILTPMLLCFDGDDLQIGDIVEVKIRNRTCIGIIQSICCENHDFKLSKATHLYSLGVQYMEFIQQFCHLYCCTSYRMIKNIQRLWSKRKLKMKNFKMQQIKPIDLTFEQNTCVEKYYESCHKPVLLWGVTGSGKTEVAIQIAMKTAQTQQVLFLVPEIALTNNLVHRLQQYFDIPIIIWNSTSQNKQKFQSIVNGQARVIIGARSAVLLPYANLGLIIVDEEHDKSYEQITSPHYSTVNVAALRHSSTTKVLLMSATPNISSVYHTTTGTYALIKLNARFHSNISKVKTLKTDALLHAYALKRMDEELYKNNQVMVFLNRRGFAHRLICKICNKYQKCLQCTRNLVWHYDNISNKTVLICHQCEAEYTPNVCIYCKEKNNLLVYGYGVEKIGSILHTRYSGKYKVGIFDSDYCSNEEQITDFLDKVRNNEINVIIGTQMLSKGHDFSKLSLVIIFMHNLHSYDFRMYETLMQNLMQISGRVGRSDIPAEVIIQSNNNTQYDLQTTAYENFVYEELSRRKEWNLSPYTITMIIQTNYKQQIKSMINTYCIHIYETNKLTLIINREVFEQLLNFIHENVLAKYDMVIEYLSI